MRDIDSITQARLDAEAATFCHCWKLVRRDGRALGFTDHDVDLVFDGLAYAAAAGLDATRVETELGLAPGAMEVSGALTAQTLTEEDLANGLYDGASVEIWLVDWRAPDHRVLIDAATLGQVRRGDEGFSVELRSLAHKLDEERGRRFQRGCAADLGGRDCGVDLTSSRYRASARIVGGEGGAWLVSSEGAADGWFTHGAARVVTGANAGARLAIRAHRALGAQTRLEFWTPPARPFAPGDELELTAGCDKSFAACGAKFSNSVNFRGFPHMPGDEALMRYASRSDGTMDGGSLFR